MSRHTITQTDIDQKIRVATATSSLYEWMRAFEHDGDGLSETEWAYVLYEALGIFMRRKMRFSRMGHKAHEGDKS